MITLMFFLSGIGKINNFDKTAKGFAKRTKLSNNISLLSIGIAALIEIVAPLIIMRAIHTNKDNHRGEAKLACFALAIFTVAATLIYHYPPTGSTYYPFISNVTTFGALLLLADQFN